MSTYIRNRTVHLIDHVKKNVDIIWSLMQILQKKYYVLFHIAQINKHQIKHLPSIQITDRMELTPNQR